MRQEGKKQLIIIIIVAVFLASVGIYQGLNKKVVLNVGSKKENISTFSKTVGELLKEKNIKLEKDDKVLPDLNAKLKDDMKIIVKRGFKITLTLDGETREIITTEDNVKNLLKEQKINISKLDQVMPSLETKLKPDDEVKIIRVEEKVVVEPQEIPFITQTVYDDNLEIGNVQKVQNGINGKKEASYKLVLNDGKQVEKIFLSEKVIADPTNEVVKKGTKNFIVTSRGDIRRFKKSIDMVATAYTAGYESTGKNPGDPGYGKTRMGTTVRHGVVAVDPKVIPLGSKLYIESMDMIAVAEDTGSAIKGNKLDIYVPELSKAKKFGKKKIKVYLLE